MSISKIKTKSLALSSVTTDIILDNTIGFTDLNFDVSGDIQDTRTTVQSNSANWNLGGSSSDVSQLSANWESTYTTVSSNSATWNYDGSDIKALTADWFGGNEAYTNLISNSAAYLSSVDLSFLSVSGNWDSTYNTVQSNSATDWNYQGTDLKDLSANWQETYTNFSSQSANNVSVYTSVASSSANWQTTFQASTAYIVSDTINLTEANRIINIVQITQNGYDQIVTPNDNTLYIIVG